MRGKSKSGATAPDVEDVEEDVRKKKIKW